MVCSAFIFKFVLFFVNVVFALAGIILMGVGIILNMQASAVADVPQSLVVTSVLTIVIGSLVFIIAFVGCCGASRLNSCMLVTYSGIMSLLMVLKIILAIIVFVYMNRFLNNITKELEIYFEERPIGFQDLERTLSCCGPNGAISYGNQPLPNSCCTFPPCNLNNSFDGCSTVLYDFIRPLGQSIGTILFVVAAIELVAVVSALCLVKDVRDKKQITTNHNTTPSFGNEEPTNVILESH